MTGMATGRVTVTPVVLDRERNLRFDFNALATAEELTGKNFLDDDVWKDLTATELRSLIYACLKHEDAELTPEKVGAMLDFSSMGDMLVIISAAYVDSMPAAAEGGEVPPLPAAIVGQ